MPKSVFSCKYCAQPFTPSANNVDRQTACTRKWCKSRHKREYQRKWHQTRYAEDAQFRAAAKARVAQHRERQKKPPSTSVAILPTEVRMSQLERTFLGLAGQIGGEDDPARAAELVAGWAARGMRGSSMPAGP